MMSDFSNNTNSILSRLNSGGSVGSNHSNGLNGIGSNSYLSNNLNEITLNSLLESNNFDNKFDLLMSRNQRDDSRSIGRSLWGCGDSHDSGIGHSPPYESADWGAPSGGIWNELGKALSNMDSPNERNSPVMLNAALSKQSSVNNPRSASIDLGGPLQHTNHGINELSVDK